MATGSAVKTALPVTGLGQLLTQPGATQTRLPAGASLSTIGHSSRTAKANAQLHATAAAGVGQQEMPTPVALLKVLVRVLTAQIQISSILE